MLLIIDTDSKEDIGNLRKLFIGNFPLSKSCPKYGLSKSDLKDYFKNITCFAGTVTIGRILYGKMSDREQYTEFVKAIKNNFQYHGEDKYYFVFEYQKNGLLHAHYIATNYESVHREAFGRFGKRNLHKESYKPVSNVSSYIDYIFKDQERNKFIFPHIHNIKRKDIDNDK